jgi:hypothetical protein
MLSYLLPALLSVSQSEKLDQAYQSPLLKKKTENKKST